GKSYWNLRRKAELDAQFRLTVDDAQADLSSFTYPLNRPDVLRGSGALEQKRAIEECLPWNPTSSRNCSCDEVCPKDFEILSLTWPQTIPNDFNSLDFLNRSRSPENPQKDL